MIDHIILTVSSFERSMAFYTKVFEPMGISLSMDFKGEDGHPDLKGYGDSNTIFFWLKEGNPNPSGVHVGFVAKDHEQIKSFYKEAIVAGAESIHAPRIFPEYYPGYYAAWVLDPDGYELELVHKS